MKRSVSVHDVAAYILWRRGRTTAMKLQKLLYYSQSWSLVWDEAPMFSERIEAWANGPVVREVYNAHRFQFAISRWPLGKRRALTKTQRETVDAVLEFYGDKSAQWLSDLSHSEKPWKRARKGLRDNERGDREITHSSMAEYYGSLPPRARKAD